MSNIAVKSCPTEVVDIFISAKADWVKQICLKYCFEVGLCVTVTETSFVYTGGMEEGSIVTLRNYPRFETSSEDLLSTAKELAELLLKETYQRTAMVLTSDQTYWLRVEDLKV